MKKTKKKEATTKGTTYQFRVEEDIKEEYLDICERRGFNASLMARKWMIDFIEKNR